jgi:hypothetical protein
MRTAALAVIALLTVDGRIIRIVFSRPMPIRGPRGNIQVEGDLSPWWCGCR